MIKETDNAETLHLPVMAEEVVAMVEPAEREIIVDATLGLGGHSEAMLKASSEAKLIGIDRDWEAIRLAAERLAPYGDRVTIVHSNFSGILEVLRDLHVVSADAVVADLGVSSLQFDSGERGFSFRFDAPLDMRMDRKSESETAAELLERLPEKEIADLIYQYGEERNSRRIARRIVERREAGEPVRTTSDLVSLIGRSSGGRGRDKIHPATRTFQALRIAVNGELEILEKFVNDAISLLSPGGRLVVITFHSLEDRIVKRAMQKASGKCFCPPKFPKCVCGMTDLVEIITRKPVVPSETEQSENPRARSAKLRACQKKS